MLQISHVQSDMKEYKNEYKRVETKWPWYAELLYDIEPHIRM